MKNTLSAGIRAAALLTAVILALSAVLAACGEAGGKPADTAAPVSTGEDQTQAAETGVETVGDDIPADTDLREAEIRFLYWEDAENREYFAENENGELVSDAIFTRNIRVTVRLNCSFDFIPIKGNSSQANAFADHMKNSVNGGEGGYDIISAHSRSIGLTAYNGLVAELGEYPVINLQKPWWPESLVSRSSIGGKTYFVSGDISTNLLYMMYVVFYNKDLAADLGIADPYDSFSDGSWTIDRLAELTKNVYADTDGDTVVSAGDRFGLCDKLLHCDAFLFGSGVSAIDNSGEKLTLSSEFSGEKMSALVEKMQGLFAEVSNRIADDYKVVFRDGRSLFVCDRADIAVSDLKEKTFEMGVLPVPKYNADQERYLTAVGNPFSLYAIPLNAAEKEMSAIVIEALASESYRTLTPAVFELTMKTKYAEGGRDAIVYDTVREGCVFDLSRIFWKVFSSNTAPDTMFENAISGTSSWSSAFGSSKKVVQNTIKSINKAFGLD
ncbi:MAG: extracellular solute-binding protein [Clostridia bacterium]|nr:extracellular solute-binding protein [Clostridia bacterium]MBP5173858.1 extracellular solute-binding protein [Clostridia bacterium]